MNQKDNPALIHYYILEEEQKLRKQIDEINKTMKNLARLRASVNEGSVERGEVVKHIATQSELDNIYSKARHIKIEEEIRE